MKIRRYFTKSAFQDAINNGTIQAFDYLHPKSDTGFATTIDAVYIGTHASHWVCYALINKYSPRWSYTSKYLTKMVSAFSEEHRSGHEGRPVKAEFLSRMTEFTSLLDRLDTVRAEADKAAEVKAKKEHVEARARLAIESALTELVKETLNTFNENARRAVQEDDAHIEPDEVKLHALHEVKRVLDDAIGITCDGGRPVVTDRSIFNLMYNESYNAGGIVKQEIDQELSLRQQSTK